MLIFENDFKIEENSIFSLTENELKQLKSQLKSNDKRTKYKTQAYIEKMLSPYVAAFNYDMYNPVFLHNCKFIDNIWFIKSAKTVKQINFEKVILDNQIKLIDLPELLLCFKLWLSICASPRYNSGQLLKSNTLLGRINRILSIIDAIVLDADKINLSQRKLMALNNEYFIDKIITIATQGVEIGVYDYVNRVRNYLLKNIDSVSLEELFIFEKTYTFSLEIEYDLSYLLQFNELQARKAKAYLYKNRAYKVDLANTINVNSAYFYKLYTNTHAYSNMKFPLFNELSLESVSIKKEYPAVPTKSINPTLSSNGIDSYIQTIELLNIVFHHVNGINLDNNYIDISVERIHAHVQKFNVGRFTSLPSSVVFKAFNDAFTYLSLHQDHLINTFLNILKFHKNSNKIDPKRFRNLKFKGFLEHLSPETAAYGICKWDIKRDDNFFTLLRENKSLSHAYYLMISSCSIVIGTVMARRQSEIISLNPFDSLFPYDIDPASNRDTDFYLKIKNSKSGVGGVHNLKETLSLPIPRSIANIVYKLQRFNKELAKAGIVSTNELTLLNTFNKHDLTIRPMNQTTYNYYLDYFCDFFETKVINFTFNEKRRFYIRQHQLRRFFAMLFFWSKSFDGLDALRKFLGHTHTEHLYKYITENTPGEVLYGVKARYIMENMGLSKDNQMYINNIESIEPILKKHFQVSGLDLITEQEAFEFYSDYLSSEYVERFKECEDQIFKLLSDHIIDLEPQFFSVKNILDGTIFRDYKLLLVVKE